MMIEIGNYHITEKIHAHRGVATYKAERKKDLQKVILKTFVNSFPSLNDIASFTHEFETSQKLIFKGIPKYLGIEKEGGQSCLIIEDFGGISLNKYLEKNSCSLHSCLRLAISICNVLEAVHHQNIIHKNINIYNVWLHESSMEGMLMDFRISSNIKEKKKIMSPALLEGNLEYISPEQTGRMNRSIDHRSDLYSLGVTLYEALTGQKPFYSYDSTELLHYHIAKKPLPLHLVNSQVPSILSDIVIKLMSKNAEDRYQSAGGLKSDLEECLLQLQHTKSIQNFSLGTADFSDKLHITQKLYGREEESKKILNTFEKVSNGSLIILLIEGYSGVGKSALVQEIYKPVTEKKGYFIEGKFDQFQRNIPYSAFITAFREFVNYLLSEGNANLERWKAKIQTAVGSTGKVLTDVVPNLELLIGRQPEIYDLPPNETQNRFNYVCRNFIKTISTKEHPLVIFIDDVQWADLPSLELMKVLATDTDNTCLLLIFSYRINEIDSVHPFSHTLKSLAESAAQIEKISLKNLTFDHVNILLKDTLNDSSYHVTPLAQLIYNKTQGNAFFVNEFLKSLHEEKLLTFGFNKQRWIWDIEIIEQLNITENVVELMAEKIQRLPSLSQHLLKTAACIGSNFSAPFLTLASQKTQQEVTREISHVLSEGLITTKGENYKFSHDRIHQAVYSLISEAEKKQIHLSIGKLLLKQLDEDQIDEHIFDIVNQITLADRQASLAEIPDLSKLLYSAARKAKKAAAYLTSFEYLQQSIELLPVSPWTNDYEQSLELYSEVSECAYLCGNFELMENYIEVVLANAKNTLDRVKAYEIRIRAYTAQGRLQEAVYMSVNVLKLLEINFPKDPTRLHISLRILKIKWLLQGKNLNVLLQKPHMKDPYVEASIRILVSGSATYFVAPALFPLFVLKAFELILLHGNCAYSGFVCATYGIIVSGGLEDFKGGGQLAHISLKLLDDYPLEQLKCMTHVIANAFLLHWSNHLRSTFIPLTNAYNLGLETGDFEFASYAALINCYNKFYCGYPLQLLASEMQQFNLSFNKLKQKPTLKRNSIFTQAVLNLTGNSENTEILSGISYKEENLFDKEDNGRVDFSVWDFLICKTILHYIFGSYDNAVKTSVEAESYMRRSLGTSSISMFYYFQSLSILAQLQQNPATTRGLMSKVKRNLKKLQKYAKHAPMNNAHKNYLVQAELYHYKKNKPKAIACFEKAIALTRCNEFINDEAICYESVAKFYLTDQQPGLSTYYLQKAYETYLQWGAIAKANQMIKNYPQIYAADNNLSTNNLGATPQIYLPDQSNGFHPSTIDLTSILKASTAISSEIEFDRLIQTLIHISIENAGAQKGFLILVKEHEMYIQAEGNVESNAIIYHENLQLINNHLIPDSIVQYVFLTKENLVLSNASSDYRFLNNHLIVTNNIKSLLCIPILNHGNVIGILYFENNLAPGIFTKDRIEVLKLLSGQMAVSIVNALNEKKRVASFIERENLLKKLNNQQKALSKAVIQTQEDERRKIAEDLHDGLGYTLSTLKLNLTSLQENTNDFSQQQYISNSLVLLEESFKELKSVSNNLMPDCLFHYGLVAAVDDLCKKINDTGRILVKFSCFNLESRFRKDFEIEVFRILQEIINNVIKHAHAKLLEIQFVNQDHELVITIEDDGIGFDYNEKIKSKNSGKGLVNITNRVNYLSGSVVYESPNDSGTNVVILLPLKTAFLHAITND